MVLPVAGETGWATKLNNHINGLPQPGHTHGVADLTATGTKDATTFLRGDNTWAVPPGGGGGDSLPFAWVFRSSDQTYTQSSLTTINWNAEAEDALDFHSTTTATERLTVPTGAGGLYQVSFALQLSGTGVGISAVTIRKNGSRILPDITSPVAGALAFSGSGLVRLVAGDYLDVQIYTNAGTSLAIRGGGTSSTNTSSFLQIVRVGS